MGYQAHDGGSRTWITVWMLTLWAITAACGTPAATEQPVTLGNVGEQIEVGFPLEPRVALAERCRTDQQARLEACGALTDGEREACTNKASAMLENCDQLPTTVDNRSIGLAAFSCSGTCTEVKCTVANPCNLGKDLDGDGRKDSCSTGARCAPAAEGTVCDSGVFFDCHCTTTYYPRTIVPLSMCECNCE